MGRRVAIYRNRGTDSRMREHDILNRRIGLSFRHIYFDVTTKTDKFRRFQSTSYISAPGLCHRFAVWDRLALVKFYPVSLPTSPRPPPPHDTGPHIASGPALPTTPLGGCFDSNSFHFILIAHRQWLSLCRPATNRICKCVKSLVWNNSVGSISRRRHCAPFSVARDSAGLTGDRGQGRRGCKTQPCSALAAAL